MDYKEIIDGLETKSVIELMQKLGADRYIERPGCVIFPTICHNVDSAEASMKLYYYTNNKIFMCYTEEGAMSIFKFLRTYYETRNVEYDWHEDIYNVILGCSTRNLVEGFAPVPHVSLKDRYRNQRLKKDLKVIPKGLLDIFVKHYPVEWLNDGISKKAMDKYNIRYSISQNKIVIPHYDVKGNLVGIRGRALNPWEVENVGKYMPIQIEDNWYAHSLSMNLYGLNETKENIRRYGVCYVGEAEKFCLQMESFNFPNCSCAVCGSSFNKYHLNLLIKYCQPREIVICFDQEEKEKSDKYFNKLYKMCEKYKNYCKISFIYDTEGLLKLKESPTDKGEEVFRKLLEKRVVVK